MRRKLWLSGVMPGFTLLEILAVVTIAMMLLAIAGTLISQSNAKRWRVRKAIQGVHELRVAYSQFSKACGGPVFSPVASVDNAFKALLCHFHSGTSTTTGAKSWPNRESCSQGSDGMQGYLGENIVDVAANGNTCNHSVAFVEGNRLDALFNADEVAGNGCPTCPADFANYCPLGAATGTQGFLVRVNNAPPAKGGASLANQLARLNPPWALFCGIVAIRPNHFVLISMDQNGAGTRRGNGAKMTVAQGLCETGPFCYEVDTNGGTNLRGCCHDIGFHY